jgi:hypothetical protein
MSTPPPFLGGKVYMRINNFKMKRPLYLKKEWSDRWFNRGRIEFKIGSSL